MKTLVVLPMGAHPFHPGHYALYKQAQDAFPGADVYIAATADTSQRPFPFQIKQKLAKLSGVPENRFVQVKSPFQAREITANLDPANTQLIFVRSEKDANKPPQAGGVKKDGNPAYLQPLEGQGELAPMAQHAYMAYLPTVEFGPGMTSATEIRTAWPKLNEKRKTALVMSLYPKTQTNPKLAANVVKMLDTAMGTELNEGWKEKVAGGALALGALGGIGALQNVAPNTTFQGHQLQLANPGDIPPEAKVVTDDKGNKIYAWKTTGQKNRSQWVYRPVEELKEFAPDEGGGGRKFIPWPEFIDAVKQIVGKDFSVTEKVVKSTIQDRFIPHDPMEYGPTLLYSYYEARAGRNKGAVSTRGSIQVGKYYPNNTALGKQNFITQFSLLKGHPFERHFDLTFDNIYKIANIIMGNTEGAYQMPQPVTEGTIEHKINRLQQMVQSFHNRAKATKNDIKKQHFLAMADKLTGELDNLISDYNEHERAGNEIARHDEEPSKVWEDYVNEKK